MMIPKSCTERRVLRMVIGDSGARGWKRGGGGWGQLAVDYCKAFGHETGIRFDELSLKCVLLSYDFNRKTDGGNMDWYNVYI